MAAVVSNVMYDMDAALKGMKREREHTKLSRTRSNIEFDTGVPSQYPLPLRLPDTARCKWCLDRDREAALERQEGTLHHNYEIA